MESYVEFVPQKMARGTIMCTFIMNHKELSNNAKVLFTVLADYARDKNFCYPSLKTLTERMHCSLNSLKKYLRELIALKFVIFDNNKFFLFCPKVSNFDKEVSNFDSKININKLNNNTPTPNTLKPKQSIVGDFETFWSLYPRKENKPSAKHKYVQLAKKGLLPTIELFRKSIQYFLETSQWNRQNGRFIPHLSNFLANEKWNEVPNEYFETKPVLRTPINIEKISQSWEDEKKNIYNSNLDNIELEELWNNIKSKFKEELGYKRFLAKAKFIELYSKNKNIFNTIDENKNITITEFLNTIR